MNKSFYVLELSERTIFSKLNDIFPECNILIQGSPQLYPLRCLKDGYCPKNANCMESLAKRILWLFNRFPKAEIAILYFSYSDKPGSQRAGIFWRDFREPRIITFNRTGWEGLKKKVSIYEDQMPAELLLGSAVRT